MAVKVRRRNNAWWVFIDHKGKRKAKRIGTSKSAAEEVAGKIEAKLKLGDVGILDEHPSRPFDAYCERWLTTYVKTHCKLSTRTRYESVAWLYLLPRFGSRDLTKIGREEMKQFIYDLYAQDKSINTVKSVLTPLRELFQHAVEDGHVTANPCTRILKRTPKDATGQTRKTDFLTREEVKLLLDTSREHFPRYYPFFLLLARTGLRIGEAMALQWEDIDFHGRFIEVRRTLYKNHISTPKNGKTRRVDMSQQLTNTFKALLLERKKETL
jgi:integrase